MGSLADAEAFVFDVDGTLVLSDDPNAGSGGLLVLPGAADVLRLVRQRGKRLALFTNGTGQAPRAVAAKLRGVGLDVRDEELLTPAVVAAEYIRRHYAGQAVLAFGTEGVLDPLRKADIQIASLEDASRASVVLIGADPDFTYKKLEAACSAVWAGAPLLVTSMAAFFASRGGRMPSTSGAIAAGIKHVTGAEPTIVGKPSALVIEVLAGVLGSAPDRLAVVGDDLDLEIRMARAAGAFSVLVLTGTSHESDLSSVSAAHRPDLVVPVVGDLLGRL
jgi:HAD superfamily hydrolase (TIGR01450 family)